MSDHTPRARKSTENFGRPASTYSDFYIRTLFQPGLADTQYNVLIFAKLVNKAISCSEYTILAQYIHIYRNSMVLKDHQPITSEYIHYLNLTVTFVNFVNLVNCFSTRIVTFLYKAEGMSRYYRILE